MSSRRSVMSLTPLEQEQQRQQQQQQGESQSQSRHPLLGHKDNNTYDDCISSSMSRSRRRIVSSSQPSVQVSSSLMMRFTLWISLILLIGANMSIFWSSSSSSSSSSHRLRIFDGNHHQNQKDHNHGKGMSPNSDSIDHHHQQQQQKQQQQQQQRNTNVHTIHIQEAPFTKQDNPIVTALQSFTSPSRTTSTTTTTTKITTNKNKKTTSEMTFIETLLANELIIPTNNKPTSSSSSSGTNINFIYQITSNAQFPKHQQFCLPWYINYDNWWTNHVGWRSSYENSTHYCFESIPSKKRMKLYRTIHNIQFGKQQSQNQQPQQPQTIIDDGDEKNDGHHPFNGGGNSSLSSLPHHCSQVFTQQMYSSGWGADMAHVVDALEYALQYKVPIQVTTREPWHYAGTTKTTTTTTTKKMKSLSSNTNHSDPSLLSSSSSSSVCPEASMYCYFLNLTDCKPNYKKVFNGRGNGYDFWKNQHPNLMHVTTQHLIDYATRPQTWLRKSIYDFIQKHLISQLLQPLSSSSSSGQQQQQQRCIVMHVRRSDVILHNTYSRRYHELEEYIAVLPQKETTTDDTTNTNTTQKQLSILLLTDDDNVIQEALTKYPQYHWMYIHRPRFKGPEGGFENHIPSNDPKLELLVLLSLFQFIPQYCTDGLIHTRSNLGSYLAGILYHSQHLRRRRPQQQQQRLASSGNVTIINLDAGLNMSEIFNTDHSFGGYKQNRQDKRENKK